MLLLICVNYIIYFIFIQCSSGIPKVGYPCSHQALLVEVLFDDSNLSFSIQTNTDF